MRTPRDRVRHAVLFELIALALVSPAGGAIFGVPMVDFGIVALVSASVAMVWNYGFNLAFDHALLRLRGTIRKSLRVRIVHTLLFEVGLTCLLVPFIAWYLETTFWQALLMDVSLIGFYALYAFVYNWAYDTAFPVASRD